MNNMVVLLLAIAPAVVQAAEPKIPKAAWDDLSRDIGHLQSIVAQSTPHEARYQSMAIGPREARITADAQIRAGAKGDAPVVTTLKKGAKVRILGQADGWFAVEPAEAGKEGEDKKNGWANADNLVLSSSASETQSPSFLEGIAQAAAERLAEEARRLKEKYDNNPYFKITGFALVLSVPPGVTVNFEFRK